jgi:hypothetical protein
LNSIYNKNIAALKKRLDTLYETHRLLIEAYKEQNAACLRAYEEKESLKTFPAKNGSLTAVYKELFLHSSYNPEAEAKKSIAEVKEKEQIAFLGFGLGYAPLAFVEAHPDKMLILIEPEIERVLWTLSYVDFSALFSHPKLICLFSAPPEDCISLLEHFGFENTAFIKNESYALHQKDFFSTLSLLIERNKQKKDINDSTLERFGKLWLKNTIKNIHHYAERRGIACLQNLHKGEKALILAAGPSLDTCLPYLPELAKKMILICVDTALDACLKAGVEPDYLITIDPQYWNAKHIRHLSAPHTNLITEISSYPSVFRFPCKNIYLTSSIYPLGKLIEKKLREQAFPEFGELNPGGSVATSAWEFARWIGCTELFFAGLDLSFPCKKTHAREGIFEKQARNEETRFAPFSTKAAFSLFSAPSLEKENYKGETVLSDSRMELYAWWFESKIAEHKTKTYVLSEEGLKIPGIDFYNIEKLLNQKNIEKKECPIPPLHKNTDLISKIKSELQKQIASDLKLCQEAIKAIDKNNTTSFETAEKLKTILTQSPLYPILPLAGESDRQIQKKARKKAMLENKEFSHAVLFCFFENAQKAILFLEKSLQYA